MAEISIIKYCLWCRVDYESDTGNRFCWRCNRNIGIIQEILGKRPWWEREPYCDDDINIVEKLEKYWQEKMV